MCYRTLGTLRAGSTALALLAAVALTLPLTASAQQLAGQAQEVTAGQTFELPYTATFSADDLIVDQVLGYDMIRLPDGGALSKLGWPSLPTQHVRIAVPEGMVVTGVRVVGVQTVELPGQYDVFPAQPALRMSESVEPEELVKPDAAAYAAQTLYPAQVAEFTEQCDLAGQAMAGVRFCPVQYVAATKQLFLHTYVEIVLEGTDGYVCGDYLPARISDEGRAEYEIMVRAMVVNPEDVELCQATPDEPQVMGVAAGTYDYVIITSSSWVTNFQPLADWKHKKGRPATVVTTTWIYNSGGYSGTNAAKIRAFMQDAHSTWGASAFLLGGDTAYIPYSTKYVDGENVPNDTYYSDYDDDWVCEVNVGRATVTSTTQIATFIDKVLTYEKDPPLTDYGKTAFFCGFDAYAPGSAEGEGCKAAIRMNYLPSGWTYRSEYDSESGTHKSDVIAYLNQGNNLVNHIDHASETAMGAGATCHGSYMSSTDMNNLYNGDRQSILYSVGCHACNYTYSTCIAETFVRNTNGGGLAFIGNTGNGYFYAYNPDGMSHRYDRYFFRSLFDRNRSRLGSCFSDHKNEGYASDPNEGMRYLFTGLTLLGDPELPFWTENPESLTVTHDGELYVGQNNSFTVQVYSGGSPLYDATVCLWKDGDIYEVDKTDATGQVTFTVSPATTGTMYVTSRLNNYLPDESSAQVVEAPDYAIGDLNCDGSINNFDIDPFVLAIMDSGQYAAAYPDCDYMLADVNEDDTVNNFDIDPFVDLIAS